MSLIQRENPDLIITDIIMPNLDGIELLHKLTEPVHKFPPKIIAMSGSGRIAGKEYLSIAEGFNADYIFEKPLDIGALVSAIKCLLH